MLEYLTGRSEEELNEINESIAKFLSVNDQLSKEDREKYQSTVALVQISLNGKKATVDDLSAFIDISKFKQITSDELIEILGITIKKDNVNKEIAFLGMLSTYTKDAQFNISFNAPSSSGKSYIPTEIATLFPQEDVIELGYSSPTAFFHDRAKEYNKEKNELVIDFTGKIIIFLDQPHTLLLQHLRPLLSHDKSEIRIKITDKSQKAGLRTKNVVLRGFPSVFFCTAGLTIDEQESTRFILLSPEINQEKIREAILERIKKSSDNYAYKYSLATNPDRQLLKNRILAIKQEQIEDVVIKNPQLIESLFFDKVKILKPRHQRDMGRIISIIKVFALLNVWFREREGSCVIASDEDIREAFKLWATISEAQELNLPPYVFNIYKEVIVTAYDQINSTELGMEAVGITRQDILKKHNEVYGRPLPDWTLRKEIIPMLEASGLIIQEADKNDKRKMLVYPTTHSTISSGTNNSGDGGGVEVI
jgi:hypothetical protein